MTDRLKTDSIVFVDRRVENYLALISSLGSGVEVVFLDSEADGVEQIASFLADRRDVAAVHIISHGSEGRLLLGTATLDSATMPTYARQLDLIQSAIGSDADILLYGCDVASGPRGQAFVEQLALLTTADVAASNDTTGATLLGGDAVLEVKIGNVSTVEIFRQEAFDDSNVLLNSAKIVQSAGAALAGSVRQLSQSSLDYIVVGNALASEVAAIARANAGTPWTTDGCTDFVWAVTSLAGAAFFDLRGAANLENGDPLRPLDIPYSVPHSGTQNAAGDKWAVISHGATAASIIDSLLPGDVVRAYKAAHEDAGIDPLVGHSFIVSKIDTSGVWVVDNTGPGGSITEHLVTAAWAYLQLPDHVYISRLDPTFALPDDREGNTRTTGFVSIDSTQVLGSIDRPGDADWFRLELVQGQTYNFHLESGSVPQVLPWLADPLLYLYDSNGRYLAQDDNSGPGSNSQITYTASYTGSYFLSARSATADGTGTYRIWDPVVVGTGSVSVSDVSISEGNSGTSVATFIVTRTGGTAAFSVNYATSDGGATAADGDYVAKSGTLNFAPGVNSQSISVTINGDTKVESTEAFFILLSGATNGAAISHDVGIGNINNDDVAPNTSSIFLSVVDNSIQEGASGTRILTFGVNLTGASAGTQTVSVHFATEDIIGASSPATPFIDYIPVSGDLVIPAGQTFGQISVTILGDTQFEPDEVFRLALSQLSNNATFRDRNFATGFINNDDQVSNQGPITKSDFVITAPGAPILIDVLANDSDPDGDVLSINSLFGGDPGSWTLADSNRKILFTPNANIGIARTFFVVDDGHGNLRNSFVDAIISGDGTASIANSGTLGDDVIIGAGGNDLLSGGLGDDVIRGGGGSDRIDGGAGFDFLDLQAANHAASVQFSDTWTWDDGDGGHDILTNIEGVYGTAFNDLIDANYGYVEGNATGYRFFGYGGNDTLRTNAGNDVLDGGDGDDTIMFGTGHDVVFGGSGNDLIYTDYSGTDTLGDYLDGGPGDDIVQGGWSTADTLLGGDGADTFNFGTGDTVSGGTGSDRFFFGGPYGTGLAAATITDFAKGEIVQWTAPNQVSSLVAPVLALGDGSSTALDHIDYTTEGGDTVLYFGLNAGLGADFVLRLNGIVPIDQLVIEAGFNPTIRYGGVAGSISISDATVTEGDSGTKIATFYVTRTGGTGEISVNYASSNGSATVANSDYAAASGTLNFGLGEFVKEISVTINGDIVTETNEDFFVTLSGISIGATIDRAVGLGTIVNDDVTQAGSISISDALISEGRDGAKFATFVVTRSGGTDALSINYQTSNNTATFASGDYQQAFGILNFAAGENTKSIQVAIYSDTNVETDETFLVEINNPTNGATITDIWGVGTIINDDGGNGDDTFNFGGAFTSADVVDGGAGNDTLNLDGNYAAGVTFAATTMANVETIGLAAGNSYRLTLSDANVAAGQSLLVDGAALLIGDVLTFDGSAETNGRFDLRGGAGADDLMGGAGNDVLRGEDSFFAGIGGNDTLNGGDGDDYMNGGGGVDTFDGGAGIDRVSFFAAAATQGAVANLITQTISNDGFGNAETMTSVEGLGGGTAFADTLTGDNNDNWLLGETGDTLIANGGNDLIQLAGAPASLDGGAGIDTIVRFVGDIGGKLIPDTNGDGLAEVVFADHGVNVDLAAGVINDDGFGGSGTLAGIENVGGSTFGDTITGDANDNVLNGWEGNDTLVGGAGNDTLDGGDGIDTIDYSASTQSVTVDLTLPTNQAVGAAIGTDQIIDVENVIGGSGNDQITGNALANVIASGAGTDTLLGGDNDDTFNFAAALTAADTVNGGIDNDTVSLNGNYAAGVTFAASTMTNVETLALTAGNSYKLTLADANVGAGQSLLVDGGTLLTGNVLTFNGSAETNGRFDLRGGAAADDLMGGTGNDSYTGNAGNDLFRLYFGGTDTASGGDNDDSFLFGATFTSTDSVDGGAGYDVVNLSGNYAPGVTFAAATMTNVEVLYLTAGNSYNLTLADANVAAGQILTVAGSGLVAGNALTFNGSAETNGRFTIQGGAGNDTLTAGAGNDDLSAGGGINVLAGNAGNDLFRLYFGGTDTASGGDNDDSFLFGASLTAADSVNGGAGYDVVNLGGNYAAGLIFAATTITNVEALYLTAGNSYNLTLADANVAAGQILTVIGSGLAAGQTLTFNGSAETNGRLDVQGGAGNDNLTAGAGNDDLSAGAGINVLAGNAGNDLFRLYFGGTDTASGGDNDDSFLFGASLTAADSVNGGAGYDVVNLGGNYAAGLTFAATTMTNVEALYLTAGNSYNLTLVDANVAAGQILTVAGSGLVAGNALTFNGSAETNGRLTIQGGAGNDTLIGGAGNDDLSAGSGINVLTGNAGNDLFRLYFGGTDTASGGDNDDSFLFGASLTAADSVNGGAGYDVVNLGGNYAAGLIFAAATMTNVEALYLTAGNSYNLTLADANVAAGQILTVVGSDLAAGQTLAFNGSAETNGRFTIQGGAAADVLIGGAGNDTIFGNAGADILTGGAGADRLSYISAGQSTGAGFDTINGFDADEDAFDFASSVTGIDTTLSAGSLSLASFDTDLSSAIGAGQLAAQHAVLFAPTAGTFAGQLFMIVDGNGTAGYQAGADFVFKLASNPDLVNLGVEDFV